MTPLKPKTLYMTLSLLMVGLVVLVYGVLLLHERSRSEALMLQQAAGAAQRIGREVAATVEADLRPARVTVALLAAGALGRPTQPTDRLAALPQLAAALRDNVSLSAVYAGTHGGSFVLLRRLEDELTRRRMDAPAGAVFALQTVDREADALRGTYRFYDGALAELQRSDRIDYDYDPRTRPWFRQAQQVGGARVLQSAPYRFYTTDEAGVTLAQAADAAVLGADVNLRALGEMLKRPKISRSAELLIVTAKGEVLAQAGGVAGTPVQPLALVTEAASPLMRTLWQRRDASGALAAVQTIDGRDWVSQAVPLNGTADAEAPLVLLMAAPRDELQAYQIQSRRDGFYISLVLMLLLLPVVHLLADRVSRPLRQLAREAEAIERFEFDGPDPKRSLIREVDRLAVAMTAMKHSLRRFLDIGGALSAERDFDRLLDRILRETIAVTGAAGGTVHLLSEDGEQLLPAASNSHGQTAAHTGLSWAVADADDVAVPVQALRAGEPVDVELTWNNPAQLKAYEQMFASLGVSRMRLLSVPLRNRQRETVGTLTLSFRLPDTGPALPLGEARVAFVRALSGTAAVAIDNQLLLRARKELLESFIRLVAGAIDAKSPYTGAHCQRVPELTKMLARAACDATEGPYAGFSMDADAWEALHIAAWLHDCGKVTTPEYVVDKATKLETIYNRIHEIRTRFEVLKRDALIERLQAELGEAGTGQAQAAAAQTLAALDADFEFVAQCNVGGETLDPAAVARLREIGARRWQRTLDDGLGLSIAEAAKLPRARPALPATETLLRDRPEHIVPRPDGERLAAGNRWGFSLKQPEHLYNHGELHNLAIARGTLNEEERYKINEHMVQTIKMLESLPFPRHLKAVPEMAGGHHERMDGKGYPRGLKGADMSPQARMMAVADVFEALTASDRPYKPGKKLSESLALMQRMARDGHLDAQVYELFLRSGVCTAYAQRFMAPAALDVPDVQAYLP
ncbi:HD domain-containing phosphohydrolase [Roseateles sp. DC23W]|uniref:HD domain-containing phosphohydrolase n=1 Tax=Pelomonas dachongensis TaxID=3299029 RepID=A0ABW7ERX3_9BURK